MPQHCSNTGIFFIFQLIEKGGPCPPRPNDIRNAASYFCPFLCETSRPHVHTIGNKIGWMMEGRSVHDYKSISGPLKFIKYKNSFLKSSLLKEDMPSNDTLF